MERWRGAHKQHNYGENPPPPPPSPFSPKTFQASQQQHRRRERFEEGSALLLFPMFSASQQLHPSLRDTRGGGGGKHTPRGGYSALGWNTA